MMINYGLTHNVRLTFTLLQFGWRSALVVPAVGTVHV